MFILLFELIFVIFGACESPNNMQGRNVGVIYSEADFGLTILFSISQSLNAGECAQGIL